MVGQRCCLKNPKAAACRSSSTSSAQSAGCVWRSNWTLSTKSPTASAQFMDVKSPQGFLDKVKMLPMLAEMGKFFPKDRHDRPVQRSHPAEKLQLCATSPFCNAGPKMADDSSPAVRSHPRPQNRKAQRRHVPHAGLRRTHHRHALAAAKSRRGTLPRRACAAACRHQGEAERPSARRRRHDGRSSGGGSLVADGEPPSGRMDVAVAIGTDPALTFSAIVPAPPDVEEYMIAGFLRRNPSNS